MRATYLEFGYEIIEVPKTTIESRAEFIMNIIS